MIVVDTNLIAYLLISGERTQQAEAAKRQAPEWAAPLLWRSEFRNLLALYIRQEIFDLYHAINLLRNAEEIMQGQEHTISSVSVMRLAASSRCSAYDCEFVALAQNLSVPLVTSDRRILTAFPDTAVSLENFLVEERH
ncbi:MAG: type II toxin-antitoxin system VapC family toxin [Gemmatimonadetes bacterium]|nr:type II toxin-antitoxin system VapC family toxin [Gemmatimonadota bacterium]MYB69997.1 type II toxin-antitoxin system VapC family toxin [Gemmatimonadota bacterium]